MRIEIINQQKIKTINLRAFRKDLSKVLKFLDISSEKITLLFCDNQFIKKLNKRYFGRISTTDVIAFPLADEFEPEYLGDIVISVEKAVDSAKNFDTTWQKELFLYVVHGILHLIGYEDTTDVKRKKMLKVQQEITKQLYLKKRKLI